MSEMRDSRYSGSSSYGSSSYFSKPVDPAKVAEAEEELNKNKLFLEALFPAGKFDELFSTAESDPDSVLSLIRYAKDEFEKRPPEERAKVEADMARIRADELRIKEDKARRHAAISAAQEKIQQATKVKLLTDERAEQLIQLCRLSPESVLREIEQAEASAKAEEARAKKEQARAKKEQAIAKEEQAKVKTEKDGAQQDIERAAARAEWVLHDLARARAIAAEPSPHTPSELVSRRQQAKQSPIPVAQTPRDKVENADTEAVWSAIRACAPKQPTDTVAFLSSETADIRPTHGAITPAASLPLAPSRDASKTCIPFAKEPARTEAAPNSSPVAVSGPAPEAAKARQWYYSVDNNVALGPISTAMLKTFVANGTLTPTAKVSQDGKNWFRAETLKGVKWPAPTAL